MDFSELIKQRCSVRAYLDKPVEAAKLNQILQAGRLAPTGANKQPQRILVLNTPAHLKKVEKAAKIFGAPLVLVVCSDENAVWRRPLDGKDLLDIDATIVTTHMMLQATELGLGSIWICAFNPDILRQEFDIPHYWRLVNLLAIGYGVDGTQKPIDRYEQERKPLNETVFYPKDIL